MYSTLVSKAIQRSSFVEMSRLFPDLHDRAEEERKPYRLVRVGQASLALVQSVHLWDESEQQHLEDILTAERFEWMGAKRWPGGGNRAVSTARTVDKVPGTQGRSLCGVKKGGHFYKVTNIIHNLHLDQLLFQFGEKLLAVSDVAADVPSSTAEDTFAGKRYVLVQNSLFGDFFHLREVETVAWFVGDPFLELSVEGAQRTIYYQI